MPKIISGNWKMNGSKKDLKQWFEDFFKNAVEFENNKIKEEPKVLICVPSIFVDYATNLADEYNKKTKQIKVLIGTQDLHQDDSGAFTGNTSPTFLKDFNVKYSIVGHSERRIYEKENDELVSKKSANTVKNGIIPLVCVGETLEVREKKEYFGFIENSVLNSTKNLDISKIIVAYEPVWAIGTGKVPTLEEIEETVSHIKKVLSKTSGLAKEKISVLYGGSVKSSNVKEIVSLPSVGGVLVGGASLKGEEFFNIVKNSL